MNSKKPIQVVPGGEKSPGDPVLTELDVRQEIIACCRKMNEMGINQGTAGNISARWNGGFLITPTGVPYDEMEPHQIVSMRLDGSQEGDYNPSSEWRFHRDILISRSAVNAVVHTHSLCATTLAIMGLDIPALHYMITIGGGDTIRCADYATYGTQELSDNALRALEDRTACLLARHGVIATGPSLAKALWLAKEIEVLAFHYLHALPIGKPSLLPSAEVNRVLEKVKTYGLQPQLEHERRGPSAPPSAEGCEAAGDD